MKTLTLISNKYTVLASGDSLSVMKKLMNIISESGRVPNVKYDNNKDRVELVFEGSYDSFSVYME